MTLAATEPIVLVDRNVKISLAISMKFKYLFTLPLLVVSPQAASVSEFFYPER